MFGTPARSGFRRGCDRASWCPPSDLVDQAHDPGALTDACTRKGPQMANPRPTRRKGPSTFPWYRRVGGPHRIHLQVIAYWLFCPLLYSAFICCMVRLADSAIL